MTADQSGTAAPALDVRDLNISYQVRGRRHIVVRHLTLHIAPNEAVGLVGESGCGKSTTALAISRYLPRHAEVVAGGLLVAGQDILAMGRQQLRAHRARTVSHVYQDPGRALNPSMHVGQQVAEVITVLGASKQEALDRAEAALRTVQIADVGRMMRAYPHQLSGGMLQRVIIAMALAANPALLVLDEPTTALDATVQADILDLIAGLRHQFGTALLLISHNLAVVGKVCDRVGVMYAGSIVEQGSVEHVLHASRHPYTVGLLRAVPRAGQRKELHQLDPIPGSMPSPEDATTGCAFAPRCALAVDLCHAQDPPAIQVCVGHSSRCHRHADAQSLPLHAAPAVANAIRGDGKPVVSVQHLSKTYASGQSGGVQALVDVNLEVRPGETLGLVGESGSGKSTLAKVLAGLVTADQGSTMRLAGHGVTIDGKRRPREQLRLLQLVFQDPDTALNRRHSVHRSISRTLTRLAGLTGGAREQRLLELIGLVRLEPQHLPMRPTQLSGGLRQRVAIARALAGAPALVVCDEPTSALDVSVQAAVLNLLTDLQRDQGLAYVFISHDLAVIRYLADRIAVLYLGRMMEYGTADAVLAGPHHPYTEALLSAALSLDVVPSERIRLRGETPSPSEPPSGCVFNTRCHRRFTDGTCESAEPPLREVSPGHFVRCHLAPASLGNTSKDLGAASST